MATTIEELQVLITAKTSGLQKEMNKVKTQMQSAQKATDNVTKAIDQSTKVTPIFKNRMAQLTATLENTTAKLELQKAKLEELRAAGSGVNESTIAQMQQLEQESASLDKQIRDLTARIAGLKEEQKSVGTFHAGMVGEEIRQYEDQLSSLIAKADETGFKMADLQEKMDLDTKRHQEKILNAEGTILRLQKSIDSTNASIAKMEEQMYSTGDAIEETRKEMNKVSRSVNSMGKQFMQAFRRIARQVLVFAVIYKGIRSLQMYLRDSMRTNQDFTAALNNLRANLMIAFQPIYDSILPALISLVQWLARATQYIAAFISGLFGRTYSESMKAAQGLQTARKAMDAYGKSVKKATSVAGFDELNLIGGEADAGGVDGAAGGVDFGALADEQDISALDRISEAMAGVTEKVREMASNVRTYYGQISSFMQQHSDIIIAALAGVGTALALAFGASRWGAIVATVQRAGAVIGAALATISLPIALIVTAIAGLTAAFVYFYRTNETFRETVHNILAKIGETALWLWNNVLVPFGDWLGSVFVAAWEGVKIAAEWLWRNVLVPFGQWLLEVMPVAWEAVTKAATWLWKNVLVPLGEFLKWIWNNVFVPVGKILVDILGAAFKFVADVAKEFWQKVLVPLGKALKDMFAPAVEAVSAVITFLWNKVLKPFATYFGGAFKVVLTVIIQTFEFLWKNVLEPLSRFVGGTLRIVFSNTFDALGRIINGLKTTINGLMNFITGVFTADWERAWDGVKDIFKGVFDSLWGIVRAPLNMIIDGVNSMIDGLNKISIDVPDWVPGMGGRSFGINIPKIPRLDVGTNYVARDGLAYLHRGEAVVPKAYNPAAGGSGFDRESLTVLRDILQAIREDRIAEVVISEKEVTRTAIRGINREARRTGRNPLTI